MDLIKDRNEEHKILFLQSWNEWGESNYVEPDLKYGRIFLDVLRELLVTKKFSLVWIRVVSALIFFLYKSLFF